jgi:hypothetical protein
LYDQENEVGAFPKSRTFLFLALKGRQHTQGVALGWYVAALSGLRKEMSDFLGMHPMRCLYFANMP